MLTYKGYTGEVQVDEYTRLFTGRVIGIFDVITFQGCSFDELEQSFHDAVDDYLDWCKELGEEPNQPMKAAS